MLKKRSFGSTAAVMAVILFGLTGCNSSAVPTGQKQQIAEFYSEYVEEATSLDTKKINTVYDSLKNQSFEGQQTDTARENIFKQFATVDPDLFDKLAVQYASYDEVGATYTSILLMSLATNGEPVIAELPLDAITKTQDPELKTTVYEIDRSQITAPVPLTAAGLVTKVDKKALKPVRVVRDGLNWKIVPDASSLNEIGIPNEK
jgi:hypothetical protein